MCNASKPKLPPPPPPPKPSETPVQQMLSPEQAAAQSADTRSISAQRRGRNSLKVDLATGGSGAGLSIPI